jgi:hypothetical protein
MNVFRRAVPCLFAFVLLTGCASSKLTGYQPYQGELAKPDRIIVYDFAATAAELPPEVAIAGQGAVSPPATPAQLAVGRRLGAETAKYLVAELQGMGLTAVRAVGQPAPPPRRFEWNWLGSGSAEVTYRGLRTSGSSVPLFDLAATPFVRTCHSERRRAQGRSRMAPRPPRQRRESVLDRREHGGTLAAVRNGGRSWTPTTSWRWASA